RRIVLERQELRLLGSLSGVTIGAGVPGCMHGGGSPDGARMMVNVKSDIDHYIELAKRLADIKEDIRVEPKKK
ncbi:hypothetical protein MBGDF03_01244, partial [Thermoplasmatales archaeon SCGC AB-540-F20]